MSPFFVEDGSKPPTASSTQDVIRRIRKDAEELATEAVEVKKTLPKDASLLAPSNPDKPILQLVSLLRTGNPQLVNTHGLGLVGTSGFFLGLVWATSLALVVFSPALRQFATYGLFLSTFHFLEFMLTAIYHPESLNWSAYLLDHSREYGLAFAASLVEYWLEYFMFPSLKELWVVGFGGIVVTLLGQVFRTGAMISAASNFTHKIALAKRQEHELVKHGLYAYVRHPSYVGWFWWSIGTQIILVNPLCACAYAYASWKFFSERIEFEEIYLVRFFGQDYLQYRRNVPVGIPFIK